MKILHTEASTGWGGQELRVLEECLEMQRRGHTVVLACPPETLLWKAAKDRGLKVEPVPFGHKPGLPAILAVRRLVRQQKFEIVNTHRSSDGWSAAIGARLGGAIHVRTRHSSNRLKNKRANLFLYKSLTDAIITTGEPLRQKLIDENGLNGDVIISAPTGVNTTRFAASQYDRSTVRRELGLPEDAFLWSVVAMLRPEKGLMVLLDALAEIVKTHPQTHLAVVGGVTSLTPHPEELKVRTAELELESHVHWMGIREDVPEILAACDGSVLPTFAEGVPQTVTQAQSMGLPVVTTNVGGIPDVVTDGETGLLVPAQDAPALAAAMIRVMDDPALAKRLGENAAAMIRRSFSLAAMTDRVEGLFERLLTEKKR